MPFQAYSYGDAERYLNQKSIDYISHGNELLVDCLFSGCDDDSSPNEHHLYINNSTGQYHCFKCGASGNLTTLKRHLGDTRRNNGKNSKRNK